MTATQKRGVRVRFAPSPTGFLHVGSVRTALFNWIFAKQNSGKFILRIEDTDKERSKPEYEKNILESLKWLGLDWDEGPSPNGAQNNADDTQNNAEKSQRESASSRRKSAYIGDYGPYRQSERIKIYRNYIERLIGEGRAYRCFCSKEQLESDRQTMLAEGLPPKYGGRCRNIKKEDGEKRMKNGEACVIRFVVPETDVEFNDLVRGNVKFSGELMGDMIIAKSEDEPLYNFAATIDDELMEITHVIRAEEHLSNTPKQIFLQQALNFREIKYAHIPLILNPDRSKMSKRYLESSVNDYRSGGYLPEAMLNFLSLLGWHPKEEKEILGIDEIIKEFDIKRVQKAGAVFNIEKLNWINSQYIKKKTNTELAALLRIFLENKNIDAEDEFVAKVAGAEKERVKTIAELAEAAEFFFKLPDYGPELLTWKNRTAAETKNAINESLKMLDEIPEEKFAREEIGNALQQLIEKTGRGEVLWPIRAALSGQKASPDPLEIMGILGKKETERRLKIAMKKL